MTVAWWILGTAAWDAWLKVTGRETLSRYMRRHWRCALAFAVVLTAHVWGTRAD